MVIRNEVMNSPSDVSGERPVSNALLVISKAPMDTLSNLNIFPKSTKVFMAGSFNFQFPELTDSSTPALLFLRLLNISSAILQWALFLATGLFTAKTIPGDCYVLISYR